MKKLMIDRRTALLGAASGIAALSLPGRARAQQQQGPGVTDTEIKVGAWYPFSGPLAIYGIPQHRGADAYFKMINDRGGIKGRKITYIVEDNNYSPQQTVAIARKLIERDQVLAIVAPNGTPQTAATFPYVLGEAKVPIINPYGGYADWYTPPRENLFGDHVLFDLQVNSVARWATKEGAKKVIILHSANTAFETVAKGGVDAVKAANPNAQAEFYPVKFDTRDYAPVALDVIKKAPDAVVFIAIQQEVVAFAKQLRLQQSKIPLYTYGPNMNEAIIALDKDAVEGLRSLSETELVTADTPAIKEYRDALAKYYPDEKPDYQSLVQFAGAKIFVEALKRIEGPINRQSLVKAIYTLRDYETGILPAATYTPQQHLGVSQVQQVQVRNGKWERVGAGYIDVNKAW